jgi:hypothetical protein
MATKLRLGDPVRLGEVGGASEQVSYPVDHDRHERIVKDNEGKWHIQRKPDSITAFTRSFATEHEALAQLEAEVNRVKGETIEWYPEADKPADAANWERFVAPIVGPGGRAVLVFLRGPNKWKVDEAYKAPKAMPVGAYGTLDTTYQSVRDDVTTMLKEAGLPVV